MRVSPSTEAGQLVDFKITTDGVPLDETIQVVSITITSAINGIPSARIVVLDGDRSTLSFPVSDGNSFKPGALITIEAGYDGQTELIFQGIVIGHGLRIIGDSSPHLVVECRDKTIMMTIDRKTTNYVDMTDSDIIRRLVENYGGLTSEVNTTDIQHKQLVQHDCTDWDFLLARAEANGLLAVADQNKVLVQAPTTSATAQLKVTYGTDLTAFDGDIDCSTHLRPVETMRSPDTQPQPVGAKLARVRGRMKFQGNAKAKIGRLISVDRVGKQFSGEVFVTAVNHRLADGKWMTEVEFGMWQQGAAERQESILMTDQNGNKVQLTSDGILLDSAQDIVMNAKGKITLSAGAEIHLTAQTDVKVTGLNIANTAEVAFTAKGNATAELSATGQTTVRGAMVMIN